MKKKMKDDDLELLRLEEIELELGSDIASRFSLQYLKGDESSEAEKERGLIWSALNEFGMAMGDRAGTPARERFVASMKTPPKRAQFSEECRRYFPTVLISEGLLPKRPPELLSTLDVSTIKSLARAWFVMGRNFFPALQEFAKRWTDDRNSRFFDRPLHVQKTLILSALGSLPGAANQNLAVAQWLADRNLLDLPAQVSKSQSGMRKHKSWSDIQRDFSSKRKSRKDRAKVLDSIRKQKERLMAPKRVKDLRAKFDLSKNSELADESSQSDELSSLVLAKYIEDNLVKDWNVSDSLEELAKRIRLGIQGPGLLRALA